MKLAICRRLVVDECNASNRPGFDDIDGQIRSGLRDA